MRINLLGLTASLRTAVAADGKERKQLRSMTMEDYEMERRQLNLFV